MKLALPDYLLPCFERERVAKVAEWRCQGLELTYSPISRGEHLLLHKEGPERWREMAARFGVQLASLSIQSLAWSGQFTRLEDMQRFLRTEVPPLLDWAVAAGVAHVHLPIYDPPELKPIESETFWLQALAPVIEHAQTRVMPLALETFWPAEACRHFLRKINSPMTKISYDVGNAQAARRDLVADLNLLEPEIIQIRLKERQTREPYASVPIGSGNMDWAKVGCWVKERTSDPWLILAVTQYSTHELNLLNQIRLVQSWQTSPHAA